MACKKLFLAHYSGDAEEVRELALELRLHGIVPWVDKDGGFAIADDCEMEARRAIREDCSGLLLYATKEALGRPFIRNVEIDEALKVHAADPTFGLFAVPRAIGFSELRRRSKRNFGVDLAAFHTVPIPDGANLDDARVQIASEVLDRNLRRLATPPGSSVSLQFSTRELMPQQPEDLLCINATALFRTGVGTPAQWDRLLRALCRVKRSIAARLGRPHLSVHGSKHLSAAFMFGRVFAPYQMDIRQTPTGVWRADAPLSCGRPFAVALNTVGAGGGRLFVEVASGHKNVAQGVDDLVDRGGPQPSVRLQLTRPRGAPNVDNSLCCAMAEQTYAEIEQVVQTRPISEIHVFAAVHQSYMMMLGRAFRGMPATFLYEWYDGKYVQTCRVPPGVM